MPIPVAWDGAQLPPHVWREVVRALAAVPQGASLIPVIEAALAGQAGARTVRIPLTPAQFAVVERVLGDGPGW